MIRTYKVLVIVGLTIFGVWGCGKSGTSTADTASPATKIAKLEEELKAATAARDTFRQKLSGTEEQLRTEVARGVAIQKERDEANAKLKQKGEEYKELQVQYEGFRKTLKDLIGQAEVALAPRSQSQAVVATPVSLTKGDAK